MATWIVSYADASFESSQAQLMESAARYGIDVRRPWDRRTLEQTALYPLQKDILDQRRGGGYWLWKPYCVHETLKEMAPDDLVIYADAGIKIVADVRPLFEICRHRTDLMLFAGHYEDSGAPGPNTCGKWTKRDCFIALDCDAPRYHDGQMVDASCTLMRKTPRSVAFVREWLLYCCQAQLLTDAANVCGLPNLPAFIEHRHDQSILSLLAIRDGVELFRHPSQIGNHAKDERFRVPGEWVPRPYGSGFNGIYTNSPYGTLLHHHRGKLGQTDLRVALQRILPVPREQAFEAWTRREVLEHWSPPNFTVVAADADVRIGGQYHLRLVDSHVPPRRGPADVVGTYVDVQPAARLVYSAPFNTQVSVAFHDHDRAGATVVSLEHGVFPTEQVREDWVYLWNGFLDNLAAQLPLHRVRTEHTL